MKRIHKVKTAIVVKETNIPYEMVLAVADSSLEYEAMLRWVLEHQE